MAVRNPADVTARNASKKSTERRGKGNPHQITIKIKIMFYKKRIEALEARVTELEKRVEKLLVKSDKQNKTINRLLTDVGAIKKYH